MANNKTSKPGQTKNIPNSLQQQQNNKSFLTKDLVDYSSTNMYGVKRKPWILTCQKWLEDSQYTKILAFYVNPENVGWQMKIRGQEVKQRMGSVLHMWRNKIRGTYFDEPRLNITFQSGNIVTYITSSINAEFNVKTVPEGLYNFYMFLELMDTERLYETTINGKKEYRLNNIYLTYHSNIFPNMTLSGYFDPTTMSFNDSSVSGQVESWSATFIVTDSFPKLNSDALRSMVTDTFNGSNIEGESGTEPLTF